MNWTAVRLGAGLMKTAQIAAVAVAGGMLAAGCGGRGNAGGGGSGIRTTDDHGDIPLNATVVIPDAGGASGQINYPSDADWFKFRGIQGVGYALQIHGFPPDPKVDIKYDLNGWGEDNLEAQILGFDGATQLANSSGTQGGTASDVTPLGYDAGGLHATGDSRFFWICPLTNDYYIKITHRRNGIGAYKFQLASSQFTTIENLDSLMYAQTGARKVQYFDDEGVLTYPETLTWGAVWWPGIEYIESLTATDTFDIQFDLFPLVVLLEDTDPQIPHLHGHVGFPNVFFPEASINIQDDEPFNLFDIAADLGRSMVRDATTGTYTGDATLRLANGDEYRVPVTMERIDENGQPSLDGAGGHYSFHLSDAVSTSSRFDGAMPLSAGLLRTTTGFPWYLDVHATPDDALPVAVSQPEAAAYNMFETALEADPGNVVRDDGSRLTTTKGSSGLFNIYYDSSLKLFQVATSVYYVEQPPAPDCGCGRDGRDSFVLDPDYTDFVGDRVRVRSGGPGETGPVLIDLGSLPPVRDPRSASPAFTTNTVYEPEGFRQPIRQLTAAETEKLRKAFYSTGFYVEVTDRFTGEPLARAEGDLGISFFPTLDPCDLPPCSSVTTGRALPQPGTVTFASQLAGEGPIEIYANGELLGSIAKAVSADNPPACGMADGEQTLALELDPGTYYWHAHGANGKTWDGHVTVTGGDCEMVLISPADQK